MEDILDNFEKENLPKSKIFSILSFTNAILNCGVLFYIISLMPIQAVDRNVEKFSSESLNILGLIFMLLTLGGMIFTIISFWKKEKTNGFKIIGMSLNLLILGFFIFSLYTVL